MIATSARRASRALVTRQASSITAVHGRQIIDSRGNPTVEVDITTGDGLFRASCPSGASTGIYEASEIRDGGSSYMGKGVMTAVKNVNEILGPALIGMDPTAQEAIDEKMFALDGTPNKASLGANAVLGISLAASKAGAGARAELALATQGGPWSRAGAGARAKLALAAWTSPTKPDTISTVTVMTAPVVAADIPPMLRTALSSEVLSVGVAASSLAAVVAGVPAGNTIVTRATTEPSDNSTETSPSATSASSATAVLIATPTSPSRPPLTSSP